LIRESVQENGNTIQRSIDNNGNILLRAFDQTGGGGGTFLTDGSYVKFRDGTLDAVGQTFATLQRGLAYFDAGNDGDMVLKLRADSDNNNEYHNPYILFAQDADAEYSAIGHHSHNLGVSSQDNALYITNGSGGETGGIVFTTQIDTSSALFTNTEEAMRINGNGRVTMSKQPAFTAYANAIYTLSGGGDKELSFNTALYNRGNHYATSGNRFTAPTTGMYFFTCNLSGYTTNSSSLGYGDDSMYLTFKKNGAEITGRNAGTASAMQNWGMISANGVENSVTISYVISLSTNDYVEVELGDLSSSNTYMVSNAVFSGYLLG